LDGEIVLHYGSDDVVESPVESTRRANGHGKHPLSGRSSSRHLLIGDNLAVEGLPQVAHVRGVLEDASVGSVEGGFARGDSSVVGIPPGGDTGIVEITLQLSLALGGGSVRRTDNTW